jgi:hypothetical protein
MALRFLNTDPASNFSGRTGCLTVGGPDPNKPCVFPFKHNGQTYFGCPVDPDDASKRW